MKKIRNILYTLILMGGVILIYKNIDIISDKIIELLLSNKKVFIKESNVYTRNSGPNAGMLPGAGGRQARDKTEVKMDIKEILSKCDHTLLGQTATWEDIKAICDDGMKYKTASVCIPPSFVKRAKEYVGDRQTLVDFLEYCEEHHEADHRALIIWDHGGGGGGRCL